MKLIRKIKTLFHQMSQMVQLNNEIREGIANQSNLINKKLSRLLDEMKEQTFALNTLSQHFVKDAKYVKTDIDDGYQGPPKHRSSFEQAMQQHPLMFAHKTFNTSHPDYDAREARNFPGKIFNMHSDKGNVVYAELKRMIKDGEITEAQWGTILRESLAEAKTVPHAQEVFERKAFVESYMRDLETKYHAYYQPGWVNLDDALFLYWVVRKLQPKVIVQTGVCNGLSSAFMMLALAKNGPDGTLHVIDMPPIFKPEEEQWKIRGKVYGVVIPEGKSSGWLVPDAYKPRYEVLNGDAKDLLPGLLKKLGKIDMFYHDSDHTYDHMMFEFAEAKKYLSEKGVIVSDDISWNASLWDFADEYKVPAYNYRGSMGIACF